MDDIQSILRMAEHLRPPSEERRRRYEGLGLWHEQSLGAFVDDQLAANARSEVRFWADGGYVGTCSASSWNTMREDGGPS